MKKTFVIFSITLLLFATFSGYLSTSKIVHASDKEYSGEEYFKGIVFGQGEVGELLTKLHSQKELETVKALSKDESFQTGVNDIVEYIKKNEPNLFEDLKYSIENQDPNELTKILDKTESLLYKYFEKISNENEHLEISPNACTPLVCGAFIALGAVIHLGVLVTQVSGFFIAVGEWVTVTTDGNGNQLANNEHISSLVLTSLN